MSNGSTQVNRATPDSMQGGKLVPWKVDTLPQPPPGGWRHWRSLWGPGVLLAGASIGAGEWLFGPAVTAQYGGTLLWLAMISILAQMFLNLEVMRYALYCGEPIVVGFFRTWPGPVVWTLCYILLDIHIIWPFTASNAAVPLAAAFLGHLPGTATVTLWGIQLLEGQLVWILGYVIFVAGFIPLIFGGTIYKMLQRVMTIKLVLVLGYLATVALLMVSAGNVWEVASGYFRFGMVPLRADTVIDGRHFSLSEKDGTTRYTVKGSLEEGQLLVTEFVVDREGEALRYGMGETVPENLRARLEHLRARAQRRVERGGFLVEVTEAEVILRADGQIGPDQVWKPRRFWVTKAGHERSYKRLGNVPEPEQTRFRELIANRGVERVSLIGYTREHGRLPNLDWALLAALAATAGAGGMSNTLFSNYARDKGWGMGTRVGAIPSAVGGRLITLSHVGSVFRLSTESRKRWSGWYRHIVKDQTIWVVASFLGSALPCLLSLQFIRNVAVSGNRVAALAADGISRSHPDYGLILWSLTLLCGFLVLAPVQVFSCDQISRRWTDIIWTVSKRAHRLQGNQVKYIYYTILSIYGVWGLITLSLFDPLQLAKIGTSIGNVALGFSALHTLYVNRTLLPRELRPNRFIQAGVLGCGVFFLGVSLIVILNL